MADLKKIISDNLINYRKQAGLTQAELAEKINYSDKAISKWERNEGTPDAIVLKQIADLYGIMVDDLMCEKSKPLEKKKKHTILTRTNITICSTLLVWLVATIIFVFTLFFVPEIERMWLVFIWAIPVSSIVLTVFNGIWGKRKLFIPILSVLVWSIVVATYLTIPFSNSWLFLLIGIPLEILIIIYYGLRK